MPLDQIVACFDRLVSRLLFFVQTRAQCFYAGRAVHIDEECDRLSTGAFTSVWRLSLLGLVGLRHDSVKSASKLVICPTLHKISEVYNESIVQMWDVKPRLFGAIARQVQL